jgi:hypothetical protein
VTSRRRLLLWLVLAVALLATVFWLMRPAPRASGPLPQEAYVWQRQKGPEVQRAVSGARELSRLVFLAGEVDPSTEPPRVSRVDLDLPLLAGLHRPVGLALRIGPLAGTFAERPQTAELLRKLAGEIVGKVRAAGIPVAELQLDYDCPETRLADYTGWVREVRGALAPTPVVITALPAWLSHRREFSRLATAADGYVLQVHALERPAGPTAPLVLCDPEIARAAVEEAASFHRPFRVALPTYGYLAGFDRAGRFLGLSAEGPSLSWPPGATLAPAEADPAALAGLVSQWTGDRPPELAGLLWYRLPVEGDRRAWSDVTFRAVRQGRKPRAELAVAVRPSSGDRVLFDLTLANSGEAKAPWPTAVHVEWDPPAKLVAADGLAGFEVHPSGEEQVRFARRPGQEPLATGGERAAGWLRFDRPAVVRASVEP